MKPKKNAKMSDEQVSSCIGAMRWSIRGTWMMGQGYVFILLWSFFNATDIFVGMGLLGVLVLPILSKTMRESQHIIAFISSKRRIPVDKSEVDTFLKINKG